jgi:PKD repeat protein
MIYQIIPNRKLLLSTSADAINLKNKFTVNPINSVKAIVIDTVTLCSDSSNEVSITIYPNPKVDFSFEYFKTDVNNVNKDSVVFTNLSNDSNFTAWFFGDIFDNTSFTRNAAFKYAKGGTYNVKLLVKSAADCRDSAIKQVNITNTGIESVFANSLFKIYPNPSKDNLVIECFENTQNGIITIIDLNGKNYYQTSLNNFQMIPISELNAGIYLVKIEMNDQIHYTKFVKN